MQENKKDFFAMLAERDHTIVEKVKEKISKRIWEGLHDPDPERRRNGNGYHAPEMYQPRRNGCAILWNG